MPPPEKVPEEVGEFPLRWEMGVRGAAAIMPVLQRHSAKVQLERGSVKLNGAEFMGLLLATRLEDESPLTIRVSGPDAKALFAEMAKLFGCDPRPPCSCGQPRLIGWDAAGALFTCAQNHQWQVKLR